MITDASYPSVVSRGSPNASVLLGGTPEEQALVEQWIHFTDSEVQVPVVLVYTLISHKVPYSKQVRTRILQPFLRSYTPLLPNRRILTLLAVLRGRSTRSRKSSRRRPSLSVNV